MEVTREYHKGDFGHIGTVTLEAPDGTWKMDGKELPVASVVHFMNFALQSLQDAYAGAADAEEAKGNFGKKYDKIAAGTIGTRGPGGGEPPITKHIRDVMRVQAKGSASVWKEYKAAKDRNAWLDARFAAFTEAQQATIRASATRAMALEQERKAALVVPGFNV